MKRKIGIALLVLFNVGYVWLSSGWTILSFGIIVGSAGKIHAEKFTREISSDILVDILWFTFLLWLFNWCILKKFVQAKRSLRWSVLIISLDVLLFSPVFLVQKQRFYAYQSESDMLHHYYDKVSIEKVKVLFPTESFEIRDSHQFLYSIQANHVTAPENYHPDKTIVFYFADGKTDSLATDGQYYGPFQGHYFRSDKPFNPRELSKFY